jgi:hypothetical protein
MDNDYLWDIEPFKHTPINIPRPDVVGEVVFYDQWIHLMGQLPYADAPPNGMLDVVLPGYGCQLTERAATVAASIVVWLGSNNGQALRSEAVRLHKGMDKPYAYLMTWSRFNARHTSVNGGNRLLELILVNSHANRNERLVGITTGDYEVAEQLMLWLASDQGQGFLTKCEAEIKRRLHSERFRGYLTNTLRLPASQVDTVLEMAKDYQP